MTEDVNRWPALPLAEWKDTCDTLHMWTQIVGKVKLALSPPVNHWWHVTFVVSARGLSTGAVPYPRGAFEAHFDFLAHSLIIETSGGQSVAIPLRPQTVAEFYGRVMTGLAELGIPARIWTTPVEVERPIPFEADEVHGSYDPIYAERFWRVLVASDRLFKQDRSSFLGKCSPVHFFWGSLDLAVTRFSGRRAPERPGADAITREAYSHEVVSAGFWPGSGAVTDAAFYAYAAPEPEGLKSARVRPEAAIYSPEMSEFILPYDEVRKAPSPDAAVRAFLESTYDAAATLGNWNRAELERASHSAHPMPTHRPAARPDR